MFTLSTLTLACATHTLSRSVSLSVSFSVPDSGATNWCGRRGVGSGRVHEDPPRRVACAAVYFTGGGWPGRGRPCEGRASGTAGGGWLCLSRRGRWARRAPRALSGLGSPTPTCITVRPHREGERGRERHAQRQTDTDRYGQGSRKQSLIMSTRGLAFSWFRGHVYKRTSAAVCVSVCAKERERERDRDIEREREREREGDRQREVHVCPRRWVRHAQCRRTSTCCARRYSLSKTRGCAITQTHTYIQTDTRTYAHTTHA
jgi:hypothetical protein